MSIFTRLLDRIAKDTMPPGYVLETNGLRWRYMTVRDGQEIRSDDRSRSRGDCVKAAQESYDQYVELEALNKARTMWHRV